MRSIKMTWAVTLILVTLILIGCSSSSTDAEQGNSAENDLWQVGQTGAIAQYDEPYRHEWCRPLPLYIRDVGVAVGIYHDVVEKALEILRNTDPELLAVQLPD